MSSSGDSVGQEGSMNHVSTWSNSTSTYGMGNAFSNKVPNGRPTYNDQQTSLGKAILVDILIRKVQSYIGRCSPVRPVAVDSIRLSKFHPVGAVDIQSHCSRVKEKEEKGHYI